jgi:hypothetical protein
VTIRRWLPWIAALGVLIVTTVVVLAIPTRHVCNVPNTHPIQAVNSGMTPIGESPTHWVCASDFNPALLPLAATDNRVPLRVGVALGGIALAVALGVGLHKARPPVPPSTAASDADTIRAGPVEEGAT